MTAITALNVRLGMDASNFAEGANLARAEVNRVAAVMRQSTPQAEKFKRDVDLLNRAFSESGKQSIEYANALEHLRKKYGQVDQAAKQVISTQKQEVSNNSALIGSIKGMVAAYVGFGTVTKSIKLAVEAEEAAVAFEVLTGSINDGALLLQKVRAFSERSPVTFGAAQQAAKTMLSFGVEVQQVEKNLQMLSDVTGGNNERFKMLSLSFSQMSAAGRLMGQDLLQMVNAGFNPLQQISKTTGESLIDLKKRMEDGGISSEEVRQAFIDATEAGGMFHGMTERLAETMGGKLNIALSDMEKAGVAAGQAMSTLVITLTDGFSEGAGVLSSMVGTVEKLSDGLAFSVASIRDLGGNFSMAGIAAKAASKDGFEQVNKVLDLIEKRNRERENKPVTTGEFETTAKEAKKAAVEAEDLTKKNEAIKRRITEMVSDELDHQKEVSKEIERQTKLEKERVEAKLEAEREFQLEVEKSFEAAKQFFEAERQRDQQIRSDVQRGAGAGIEAGSEQAAKFMADQVNARIGVAAVPERPTPGEKEIADKAKELLAAQREANAMQSQQLQTQMRLLEEFRENKFTRIR